MQQETVKSYTDGRLKWLSRQAEHPQKACLANLRRGVGKEPGELPELWGILLETMPEELQGRTDEPSRAEWAVYLALTLYAVHQQGHSLPTDNMYHPGVGLGQAVRRLVKEGEEPGESSALKRLNRLATSADLREASTHLRGIVQMLRAADVPLDYAQLAEDLYRFQFPDLAPQVKLRWGRDFYRSSKSTAENTDEKEKE